MFDAGQMRKKEDRTRAVEARIAELQGVINAAHGELVDIAAAIIDEDLGMGTGVHTPALYLAWKAGISSGRANDIVRLAKRRDELPTCIAALAAGTITVDQAAEIARRVPAAFEQDATVVGKQMTVRQLRRTLPHYGHEADADPDDPDTKPKPKDQERSAAMGFDERGWWLRARLPEDEGAVVAAAIKGMRDDLYRQKTAELPDGERPDVSSADGLLCAAEAALRAGEAAHPGTDRYLVHLHLEQGPNDDEPGVLTRHLGTRLPEWLRKQVLCDCAVRGVAERGGVPVAVGRKTRTISSRLRRLIEHRDGGCAVPGCSATAGLEIHHIVHWEDDGTTDPHNLVALCRHHHRQHHIEILGIEGNANLAFGQPGALTFRDQFGRIMAPSGATPASVAAELLEAATERGIEAEDYPPPIGERVSAWGFHLNRRQRTAPSRPNQWAGTTDPTRAGPQAAPA